MKNHLFAALLSLGLLAGPAARAQTPGSWGTWFIGTLLLPGTKDHRWGGFAEGQVRTNALFSEYFYHELKGGLSYDVDPNFSLLLGGGRYATADYRDLDAGPLTVEKRLWEQVVLTQYARRVKVEHRYRVEQRWLDFRNDSTAFQQRLRYRLNAFLPLNKPAIGPGTVFLSVYDEVFLNPRGPVFERNRVFAGLGYQAGAHLIVQAGWVNQANYNLPSLQQGQFVPQNNSAKNNLVLSLSYKLLYRSAEAPAELLPSQQD